VRQRGALAYRSLADGQNDVVHADGGCCKCCSIEHEVRHTTEQRLVLAAERLALGAVRDHELPAAPCGDRTQLRRGRESGAAAAGEPAGFDQVDQPSAKMHRRRAIDAEVLVERDR